MTGKSALSFPRYAEIPYQPDATRLLAAIRDLGSAVLLDSGGFGDIDILAADPYVRLTTFGAETSVATREREYVSLSDPFDLVRDALGERLRAFPELPFEGGAIGYFGYDLARRIERLPELNEVVEELPDLDVGIYDWVVVMDHGASKCWLVGQGRDPQTQARWSELLNRLNSAEGRVDGSPLKRTGDLSVSLDRSGYERGFGQIERYIRDGDCYQINYAMRFGLDVQGDALAGYQAIREINPAPYGAFLEHGDVSILSFSPERFLKVEGPEIMTSPIKGTRPRGDTPEQDRALRDELLNSEKDRAENLMIVDLLRNDLGRVCEPGSIEVSKLFELESFSTVHHLVSTISGRLREGEDALSLLRACFPGGSITGAPKIRAMEVIEELEGFRRGVYCGAIGYLGFDGNMDTSIAIRTLVKQGDRVSFWAGGGVVADSTAEAEYHECLAKAAFLLNYFDCVADVENRGT